MGTPYSKIFEAFLDKISDYDLPFIDRQATDDMLLRYMNVACAKFQRICIVDLSDRNDGQERFNGNLSDDEIDIITEYMVVKWWEPKKNNSDLVQDMLSSKDYHALHSPANLLSEIRKSYKECNDEYIRMVREYSVIHGNISDLKVR